MSRQLNVSCASIVALLSGMAAAPAIAQTPDSGARPPAETSSQEIVVTGSLIGRRDYKAVSPIVTLNSAAIEKSGAVTLESALNLLPQMGVGTGSSTIQNRTGRSSVNLRGLGENRALVLLNGRRVQPGEPGGAVDLTVIPAVLVKSVETITGGASAAYGSDAMAGVVNILLRNDLQGLTANAQVNVPEDGKGMSQDYSLAAGGDFKDGRGRADVVLSYTDRASLGRKDRDFFRVSTVTGRFGRLIVNNASNPPSQAAINTAFAKYGYAAGTVDRTTTLSFNDDLSLFTPAPGNGRTIANYKGGFDEQTILLNNSIQGNQGYTYTLVNPLTRYNVFSHAEYDLTNNIKWFGEGLFTSYRSVTNTTAPQVGVAGSSLSIPATNPFIPADLKPLLSTRATPNGPLSAVVGFDTLPLAGYDTTQNVYQLTTGLNGDVGFRDWSWSTYVSHGETRSTSVINAVNLRLIQQLLEAPDGGNAICAGGLNLFVPDAQMSPSCLQYISYRGQNQVAIQQTNANAMLNGGLFALPGGGRQVCGGLVLAQ